MADYVHPTSLEVSLSASDLQSPWTALSRADALTALAIPLKYRKWTGSAVAEMTTGEKATADAAIESARQTAELSRYDAKTIDRAMTLILVDEINNLRQWIAAFKVEVAAATNLANLQSRVAGLPAMPDRTAAQARTAIVNKLGTL